MEDNLKELLSFYKAKYTRNESMYKFSRASVIENRYLKGVIEDLERITEGKKAATWEIKT